MFRISIFEFRILKTLDITVFNYTFYNVSWSTFTWENLYDFFGIKEFIYFISSPSIQDTLFPIKIVFVFFTAFFFCVIIWLYVNSSYVQHQFLQDATEFLSHETYGLRNVNKSWKNIKKRIDSGAESDLKLAIIEADDFLYQTLQDADFEGDTFEELIDNAHKKISFDAEEIILAHNLRNSIVYNSDYKIDQDQVKKMLLVYENSIKNIATY